jgi:hypothetical protein
MNVTPPAAFDGIVFSTDCADALDVQAHTAAAATTPLAIHRKIFMFGSLYD